MTEMNEDLKIYLCIAALVALIVIIARYPSLLAAFACIGKPTARCRDGSLSYSVRPCGTCSHHGGVQQWFQGIPV